MEILLLLLFLFYIYMLPGISATYYSTSNNTSVLLINLFLGWTIIGWVCAMMLSFKSLTWSQILKTLLFASTFGFITLLILALP